MANRPFTRVLFFGWVSLVACGGPPGPAGTPNDDDHGGIADRSAVRGQTEHAIDASNRYHDRFRKRGKGHRNRQGTLVTDTGDFSAYGSAERFDDFDPSHFPRMASVSEEALNRAFSLVRDRRYLQIPYNPDFLRRESWLYPDDGCFARAELAARQLTAQGLSAPQKVFIFGDLEVETANAPYGKVWWWYHVVPAYRVRGGEGSESIQVLDPAIEPSRPLPLGEWVLRQVSDASMASVSICEARAYEPGDSCQEPGDEDARYVDSDEEAFLDYEWVRQLELGRDPLRVLGDFPPWESVPP